MRPQPGYVIPGRAGSDCRIRITVNITFIIPEQDIVTIPAGNIIRKQRDLAAAAGCIYIRADPK